MFCCVPTGIDYQDTKILKLINWLAILEALLGILILPTEFYGGLKLMVGSLILLLALSTRNWCCCIFYILICLGDMILSLPKTYHNYINIPPESYLYNTLFTISLLKYPFYSISIFYTFSVYREFKALFIEKISNSKDII
jgi:hypothetical protein